MNGSNIQSLSYGEYVRVFMARAIGNFLVLSSIFLVVRIFSQPLLAEVRYYSNKLIQQGYVAGDNVVEELLPQESILAVPTPIALIPGSPLVEESPSEAPSSTIVPTRIPTPSAVPVLNPEDQAFSLVIPKIGATAPVVPNVNPANEQEYLNVLSTSVAHAEGTAFPGQHEHIFLFAHSTDYVWNVGTYNAVFYLLYKLEQGDEVSLFFGDEQYRYTVTGKKIVNPNEIEYLTRQTDYELLTLQTCWPPGTTLQRLLVFAERQEGSEGG